MPTIKLRTNSSEERMAYQLVRRAQAAIASYLHFGTGDLAKYLDRDAFRILATRLASKYFHRSLELVIFNQIVELYHTILIMAPILQRMPLSCRFDWHRGHLLGFFRRNASCRVGRFHVGIREVERRYQPDVLAACLELIGIHDADMLAVLHDQYRRHAGGNKLKDTLAHQLFDPIVLMPQKQGFELRHGNRLLRLEKAKFEGSVDLRSQTVTVLDFGIRSAEHTKGRHLEIFIATECLSSFRQQVNRIVDSSASTKFKVSAIENCIRDLMERIRPARSALPQIQEHKIWLANKLRGLAGNNHAAKALPNLLVNTWLQRSDSNLYLKKPTFFLDASDIDEKTYCTFFSPYREV